MPKTNIRFLRNIKGKGLKGQQHLISQHKHEEKNANSCFQSDISPNQAIASANKPLLTSAVCRKASWHDNCWQHGD